MSKLILDSTQAKCARNCLMRYYLNYVKCLKKSEYTEDSVDIRFGSAIHSGVELLNEKTTEYLPIMNKFKEEFVDLPGETVKTLEHGVKLRENFIPYYKANFSEWETLQTEETSSIDIGGGIDYKVKIDRVIRWRDNIYVVDWKAQPLDAKILTPTGWTTMGKLKIGDKIIGSKGTPVTVEGIFPQGEGQSYEVEFTDGAKVTCSKEHLWTVTNQYGYGKPQTFALEHIMKKRKQKIGKSNVKYNFRVPIVEPIQFKSKKRLPIHPFLLGALIGDGIISGHTLQISVGDKDSAETISNIEKVLPKGVIVYKCNQENFSWQFKNYANRSCNSIIRSLKKMNLFGKKSNEKFIPSDYMFSSIEDRIELLQGLMDTDGCNYKGYLMYDTTSKCLAGQVVDLVRSLGGTARMRETTNLNGRNKLKSYRVHLRVPESIKPFKLTRKLARLRPLKRQMSRYIKSIKKYGTEEMQCIKVDAPDQLYVTDGFILTHNTTKSTRKSTFFNKFTLDFQPTGYVKWCQDKYGQCSGFIPVAMFMGYRKNKYKGEPAGFHCSFDYTIVNRTKEEIDLWAGDMLNIADQIEQAKVTGFWGRNPEHCSSFRGCVYSLLCQSCYDPMVEESLYEVHDPYSYLELEEKV